MRLIERQETIEPMKKERELEILLLQLTTRYVNRREMKIHRCCSLFYSNMSNFLLDWTDKRWTTSRGSINSILMTSSLSHHPSLIIDLLSRENISPRSPTHLHCHTTILRHLKAIETIPHRYDRRRRRSGRKTRQSGVLTWIRRKKFIWYARSNLIGQYLMEITIKKPFLFSMILPCWHFRHDSIQLDPFSLDRW